MQRFEIFHGQISAHLCLLVISLWPTYSPAKPNFIFYFCTQLQCVCLFSISCVMVTIRVLPNRPLILLFSVHTPAAVLHLAPSPFAEALEQTLPVTNEAKSSYDHLLQTFGICKESLAILLTKSIT